MDWTSWQQADWTSITWKDHSPPNPDLPKRGLPMPSNAYTGHLLPLLRDAEELDEAHEELRTGAPGRQYGLASLNRATVVMCVSAWEAYIEELVRESLTALRPIAVPNP